MVNRNLYHLVMLIVLFVSACSYNNQLRHEYPLLITEYKRTVDSLKSVGNKYISYRISNFNQFGNRELFNILVENGEQIHLITMNNVEMIKRKSIYPDHFAIFDSIQKYINVKDTMRYSYPMISTGDDYSIEIYLNELHYHFNTNNRIIYDNRAFVIIKSILFDLEKMNKLYIAP